MEWIEQTTDKINFKNIYLFIYLFIYDKGPESATDMPTKVNSKLTHYIIRQIRQISTENKRFKNRQAASFTA